VSISQEGHVQLIFNDKRLEEKISGAGVFSDNAKGWGYMLDIQQIGENLYACGCGGQIYKRTAPNHWDHIDDGVLQEPKVQENIQLYAINGPIENDMYVVGCLPGDHGMRGIAYHFDGKKWEKIVLPEIGSLCDIQIESPERIWICGHNGTLLLGNARDGFKDLSRVEDNQLFLKITMYKGVIYLGSNLGLYCYDPQQPNKGITTVVTGLSPEVDAHTVDAHSSTLLAVGEKDIAYFDGKTWTRLHHPDNEKIGD